LGKRIIFCHASIVDPFDLEDVKVISLRVHNWDAPAAMPRVAVLVESDRSSTSIDLGAWSNHLNDG